MTTNTNTNTMTALEMFGADAAKIAQAGNMAGNAQADSVLHFTQAVLDAEQGGNNPRIEATFKVGKGKEAKEVTHVIDRDFLVKYAKGELSEDQVKLIMPTLRELTPAHKAAFDAFEATKAWDAVTKADFAAHIDRLRADLDMFESKSARTTAWRPVYFAALLLADPELDENSVEIIRKDRKSEVTVNVTKSVGEGEAKMTVVKRRALSHKNVAERLDKLRAGAKVVNGKAVTRPNANGAGQGKVTKPDTQTKPTAQTGVTIVPGSFAKGGEDRKHLADAWQADTDMLTAAYDNEVKLTSKERRALLARIMAEVALLDAEALADFKAEVAKM